MHNAAVHGLPTSMPYSTRGDTDLLYHRLGRITKQRVATYDRGTSISHTRRFVLKKKHLRTQKLNSSVSKVHITPAVVAAAVVLIVEDY